MTERGSGNPTPIDLAAEIKAAVTSGQIKTEEQRREEERREKARKEAEEKARREAENLEHNNNIRRIVQEIGIQKIFTEARDALVQHYPSASIIEEWIGTGSPIPIDKDISNAYKYHEYEISLAWRMSNSTIPITRVIDSGGCYYVSAKYDMRKGLLRIFTKDFNEDQWQNKEELKQAVLYSIKNPHYYRPSPPPRMEWKEPHGGGP